MTKEIHDINTKALDFVVELIDYIAEYPDDDYMTMECLCRKLVKYDLIDKEDGYYLVDKGIKIAEPCDECVFVKGSGWCDNCNGKPKGLDALPNSRKAEQTEPQGIVLPRKGCHRPIELPCHSEQGDEYCANCIYWHEDFEGVAYGKPQTEAEQDGEEIEHYGADPAYW